MSKRNSLAFIWLFLFFSLSMISYFDSTQIQHFQLAYSMQPWRDVMGRSVVLLLLNATANCILTILPIVPVLIMAALMTAFGLSLFSINSKIRTLLESMIDALGSLPSMIIALSLASLNIKPTLIVGSAGSIIILPHLIRYYENHIRTIKVQNYYVSTIAMGANSIEQVKSLLPELKDRTLFMLPYIFSRLIFVETSLSFLGLSYYGELETWGQLINQGKDYFIEAPWIMAIAGSSLLFTLWSFHLLSENKKR